MQKKNYSLKPILLFLLLFVALSISAQTLLKGVVKDAKTHETLTGVTIAIKGTTNGIITDIDGNYKLNITPGKYTIVASYISYVTFEIKDVEVKKGEPTQLNIPMLEDSKILGEVVVTSFARINNEVSLLSSMKNTNSIVSGISSQQITKNQDRDASEVVKRIPGISIIDGRFIVARGLAQRYNNVWINNSATPSTETDSHSFSFDIIPSSQIENIMIVKSPQPELPADFTGGFIKVATKSIPNDNSMQISYGVGVNTQTQFKDFNYAKGSSTDFLGFDNGLRETNNIVPDRLDNTNKDMVTKVTKNGFNNDWTIKNKKSLPDQRFSFAINRKIKTEDNKVWGITSSINYTNSSKTYSDMTNARFGIYNTKTDEPSYLYKYNDNQYSSDVRLGALANVIYMPNEKHKYEFRNIFNQLGKDRYTYRDGYQYVSGLYVQRKAEYLYTSRLTYAGQLAGTHTFSEHNNLDWTAGYSFGNKKQPDRRIINREENGFVGDPHFGEIETENNGVTRDFSKLDENTYSLTTNYKHDLSLFDLKPTLKVGAYAEMRDRNYKNRMFYYRWHENAMPENFSYLDPITGMLLTENYGADKMYLYEDTDNRNSYSGKSTLLAAYAAFNIPLNKFNIYAGVRVEHSKMSLTNYTKIYEYDTKTRNYDYTDIFPSMNVSYNLNEKNVLRFAYGRSVNRQEFREVSPSNFYDFDLFSFISGNVDLKPAYINNIDLKYEIYPSAGEIISLSLFYKNFKNPIEWSYFDAGGSYVYTFINAKSADNYGIELDLKKSLDFIGLNDLSLSFNGALIKSNVKFDNNSNEHDRAMQGQSPYLINTGLFYQKEKLGLSANILYNIIGKRIVGIGRVSTTSGTSINNNIPDMYELPRNTVDLSVSKKIGKRVEVTTAVRDLLGQKAIFKQYPKFNDTEGKLHEREQTTKEFKPGTSFLVTARLTL